MIPITHFKYTITNQTTIFITYDVYKFNENRISIQLTQIFTNKYTVFIYAVFELTTKQQFNSIQFHATYSTRLDSKKKERNQTSPSVFLSSLSLRFVFLFLLFLLLLSITISHVLFAQLCVGAVLN